MLPRVSIIENKTSTLAIIENIAGANLIYQFCEMGNIILNINLFCLNYELSCLFPNNISFFLDYKCLMVFFNLVLT